MNERAQSHRFDQEFQITGEEPTVSAHDFGLEETISVGDQQLDLPADFDGDASVSAEDMYEFTTRLQETTEVGKFYEALQAKDLFTTFVQLRVAYENKLEDLFVMQQEFVGLINEYLKGDQAKLDGFYVKLLEILKALVVSGELDRVFESVTQGTEEKLRNLTDKVTGPHLEARAQKAQEEVALAVFCRATSEEFSDVFTAYIQLEKAQKFGMTEYVQMKADFLKFIDRELAKSAQARDEKLRENLQRLRDRIESGDFWVQGK